SQLALPLSAQPTNGHASQPLPGSQPIDLGSIEGQTRQGRAPQHRCEIASPALLLEPPALFEFTIGIILNVPAWTKGLQSRKAISEPARTHQGSGRLGGYLCCRHIADETGPQAGIGHPVAGRLLGKAV